MVVVIDDEVMIRQAMACLLAAWGYEVVAAGSEDDAVAKLADGPAPALLVVDWRLRDGRTGGDAVARLRNLFRTPMPAIILTGETLPDRLLEIARVGCPVLHKPTSPAMLKAMVAAVLAAPDRGLVRSLDLPNAGVASESSP